MTIKAWKIPILIFLILLALPIHVFADVDFDQLNGSDLGMGIGARAIGLGGAFVSIADDASAMFWNPSGLANMTHNQLSVSVDSPLEFNSALLILKPSFLGLDKVNLAMGIGVVNRLSFKGDSGEDTWEGPPSYFLDVSMIDMEEDFSGTVSSRTMDARLSLALTLPQLRKLSLGVNFIYID